MLKTKYDNIPDNFSLENRLVKGEAIEEIFDGVDYWCEAWGIDETPNRPITVRIRDRYNYVLNNSLLFENWFTYCRDFQQFDEFSYAYRDVERKRGVLIDKFGKYVIREEFKNIEYGNHNGGGRYAIVEQGNGKLNIIDLETRIKASDSGLDVDGIIENDTNYDFDIFIVEKGIKTNFYNDDWRPQHPELMKYYNEFKDIQYNFYKFGYGILSPNMWFDGIEPFRISSKGYGGSYRRNNSPFAVVYKNGKYNLISQSGILLSPLWFDVITVYSDCNLDFVGVAGILKSSEPHNHPDCIHDFDIDTYSYNPKKYDLYHFDKKGH